MSIRLGAALPALSLLLAPAAALAGDGGLGASYDISLAGFSIARGNLAIRVEKDAYTARVGYRVNGVGRIVSGAKGEAIATGTLKPERPLPASYSLDGQDKKPSRVEMGLVAGSVKTLSVLPPPKEGPERIPVKAEHKANVLDPLSAIVMPLAKPQAGLGPEACNRTLPVFDGWTRFDIKLSYNRSETVVKPNYRVQAVVCSARFVPIAGHKPDKEGTKFMEQNREIEVSLAAVGDTGLVAPVRISILTMSGTLVLEADKFEVSGETHAAAR
jgi:hypothetical protein